jgi:heat shock protein HslJ
MIGTPQYIKSRRDHAELSMLDGTPLGPRRTGRASKAVAICAAAAVGLFALASSGCGSTTTTRNAADVGAVEVAVTAPSSGSVIAADQVMVRGTVTPANATVQVQGEPAAVGNGVFTGTATLHGGKTTVDVIGSAPGASPGSTSVVIDRQSTARGGGTGGTTRQVSPAPTPAIPNEGDPSSETSCGGGLAVGPDTTCAFAENVRSAYDGSGPGTVMAYSPVTNRTYAMTCSTGSSVVCTGGDNASVHFASQSAGTADETTPSNYDEPSPATARAGTYAGETGCGGGLAVGPDTTCPFAENVRSAYDNTGPGTVMAYSPVTNRTYAMTCSAGSPVVCSGGDNATVYIP